MSFRLLSSMHGTYCYVQPADIRNPRTPYVPSKFCDPLKDAHPKIFALEHGKNYEKVCEMCHITLNKIAIFGDNGTITPGGVRIGTPAMTSRGCLESDFETIAEFLLKAAHIASAVLREHGKSQKLFLKALENNKDIVELRIRVESFASQFAMPGFDI